MLTDILSAITGQTREARFTEFVERQSRFVYKVAWAILRNKHDAEDIVQETFLKLYRNHGWESLNDERAFLARAAWRLAVDRVKSRGKTGPPVSDSPDPAWSAEHALIDNHRTAVIHRLVDALPEDLRQPLALFRDRRADIAPNRRDHGHSGRHGADTHYAGAADPERKAGAE